MEYWPLPGMSAWQFSHSGLKQKELKLNWNIVQGSWQHLKNKVTAHWEKLDTTAPNGEEIADEALETATVVRDQAEKKIK